MATDSIGLLYDQLCRTGMASWTVTSEPFCEPMSTGCWLKFRRCQGGIELTTDYPLVGVFCCVEEYFEIRRMGERVT